MGAQGANAPADRGARLLGLTDAESEAVELLAEGLDNTRIASRLGLSVGAVKARLGKAMRKAHAAQRSELLITWLSVTGRLADGSPQVSTAEALAAIDPAPAELAAERVCVAPMTGEELARYLAWTAAAQLAAARRALERGDAAALGRCLRRLDAASAAVGERVPARGAGCGVV